MEQSRLNRPRVKPATLPGQVPHVPIFDGESELDVNGIATTFIHDFQSSVAQEDWTCFSQLWATDSFWKDSLTLTWDKRTLHGQESIVQAWKELSPRRHVSKFDTAPDAVYGMKASFTRMAPVFATLDVPFAFQTCKPCTKCVGLAKLIPQGSDWKIWILSTAADHLEDHSFRSLPSPEQAMLDPIQCGRATAQGLPRIKDGDVLDAVVVGGSIAGLGNLIMLQSAGLNVVAFDKELTAGGRWTTKRYESFRLHHPKKMIQLPFIPASPELDEFLSGKQVTTYMSNVVQHFRLPFFGGIEVLRNEWNQTTNLWTVHILDIRTGFTSTVRAKNLVITNGFFLGDPLIPTLNNSSTFPGPIEHSAHYRNPKPYIGKDVVIVGSGNSAHDIADDLIRNGAVQSVTILQKSPLVFLATDLFLPRLSALYKDHVPVEASDFMMFSMPVAIQAKTMGPAIKGAIQAMGERNKVLEEKGYVLSYEPPMVELQYDRKMSNFFMDHPNIYELIAAGKIQVKQGEAVGCTAEGLIVRRNASNIDDNDSSIPNGHLEPNYTIPCQAIILATGYETTDLPSAWAASGFLDTDSASKIENVNRFGIDSEGEMPGYASFSGHEHLWFSGINFAFNRSLSRATAIQVVADVRGCRAERFRRD